MENKRQDISFEKEDESNSKVRSFKLKLLGKALTLHHSLVKKEAKSETPGVACKGKMQDSRINLKEIFASSESGEFYSVFLGSKLCEKIQIAILDQAKQLSDEEQPPHMHLLEAICLKSQDFCEKIQFFNEVGNYYHDAAMVSEGQQERSSEGRTVQTI